MKAITLHQPWAGLLALGIKEFETRSWDIKHRGELAIHASKKTTKEGEELLNWLANNVFAFKPGEYRHSVCTMQGVVLGTVVIQGTFSTNNYDAQADVDQTQQRFGDFSPNRYFWRCDEPELFTNPIPAKGKQSLWNWERPADIVQ